MLQIRRATKADAQSLIDYVKQVATETDFLTIGAGDFKFTVAQEEQFIEEHNSTANQIFLVAELNQKIVGLLNVSASQKPRLMHIGDFGITVLKEHWHKGIATALIQAMLNWAKASGVIRKINLTVQANNEAAIKLYKKFGFEKEGTIKRGSFANGAFFDDYVMGILID